jgi:hypothetical protein
MPNPNEERQYAKLLLSALELQAFSLEVADKPDVRMVINGCRIGLEVTDATPEEYRRAKNALKAPDKGGCIFTEHLQHRPERRVTDKLIAEGVSLDGPWVNSLDSFNNWTSRIEERIRDKQRAFAHPDFQRFDQNWLLIADLRHSKITNEPDLIEAGRFFHTLVSTFRPTVFFDRTFILTSNAGLIDWDHRRSEIVWKVTPDRTLNIR